MSFRVEIAPIAQDSPQIIIGSTDSRKCSCFLFFSFFFLIRRAVADHYLHSPSRLRIVEQYGTHSFSSGPPFQILERSAVPLLHRRYWQQESFLFLCVETPLR